MPPLPSRPASPSRSSPNASATPAVTVALGVYVHVMRRDEERSTTASPYSPLPLARTKTTFSCTVDVDYVDGGESELLNVITIDGPGGVGKSTVARLLAEELDADYLDTGAMYRTVALAVLDNDVDPHDGSAIGALVDRLDIKLDDRVFLDGREVTHHIRTDRVTAIVATVAKHSEVRTRLRRTQRTWAEERHFGIAEGRDMGSMVFKDARLKIFLNATLRRRAERRHAEFPETDIDDVMEKIRLRDEEDTKNGHFVLPDNGIVVDTTDKSALQVVARIVDLYGRS
jgi:CMP/dCMP kinase